MVLPRVAVANGRGRHLTTAGRIGQAGRPAAGTGGGRDLPWVRVRVGAKKPGFRVVVRKPGATKRESMANKGEENRWGCGDDAGHGRTGMVAMASVVQSPPWAVRDCGGCEDDPAVGGRGAMKAAAKLPRPPGGGARG